MDNTYAPGHLRAISFVNDGFTKNALVVFFGLLGVNALMALAATAGLFGDRDWAALGTTLLLAAGCLTIATNSAALERNRLGYVPFVAAALSCLSFALLIVLLWVQSAQDTSQAMKVSLIVLVAGIAGTLCSLLAIPSLGGFLDRARLGGYVVICVAAVFSMAAVVVDQGGVLLGLLSIVLATAAVVPLTGIFPSQEFGVAARRQRQAASRAMVCPACAAPIARHVAAGSHQCAQCGIGIHLQVTAPQRR